MQSFSVILLSFAFFFHAAISLVSYNVEFNTYLQRRSDIIDLLGPKLSPGASIFLPNSTGFDNATKRWQDYADPSFSAAVNVMTEGDVIATVQYANQNNIPFLAKSGGHGAILSLGKFHNGIEINMRGMKNIQINKESQSATIQGGALNGEVTNALWNFQKQTVSGAGVCSGFVGALLGGGHGFLQGRYGLIADNLISARLVTANGTATTVSATSHSDLLWALRGAGHNFGVITQLDLRVYDVASADSWYYETFIFGADQIEDVFTEANQMSANYTDPALLSYAVFIRIPTVDSQSAVLLFSVLYNGPMATGQRYAAPYRSLSPLSITNGTGNYPGLAAITGNDDSSQICQDGYNRLKFPLTIQQYNVSSQRSIFDLYNATTSEQSGFNTSLVLFEAYSIQAVQAVPMESTAVPNRSAKVIVSPVISYLSDVSLDQNAVDFGSTIRRNMYADSGQSELYAYVNYAYGDESLQELYGYDTWRLERLKALKAKWDPYNRFRFFAPVIA